MKNNVLTDGHYRITALTDGLLRLEYSTQGQFVDQRTIQVTNRSFPVFDYTVIDKADQLEIITKELHLFYDKQPFSPSGLVIQMTPADERYGGTYRYGDHPNTLKGTARTLDGCDGETPLQDGIISRDGFALLDDSETMLLADDQTLSAKATQSTDLYFFGYNHHYKTALHDFYRLSGATPLLPRFTLGNWWSRYWPYTEASYLKLMERFRAEQIPLSVGMIDMDWHLTDTPKQYGSSWTGYTWNKQLFPDPERFLTKLHTLRLQTSLNVHPAEGIRPFEAAYQTVAKALKLDQSKGEPASFDLMNLNFRRAYFELVHRPLEEEGVDFWWIDWQQGTVSRSAGVDPLWLLNHYHYLDHQLHHAKGLILSRYAGPGSHRYPIGFSGDTIISWRSLAFQPYFTATASNIGYGWWSHDIGGHMGGVRDAELTTRWMQLGVFSPINRLHSSNNRYSGKEPWKYDSRYQQIMTEFLRLRHRLVPYLYTMNVRAHEQGSPLIEPMYYTYPRDDRAYQYRNQYRFGTQMMVMPITAPESVALQYGTAEMWFPEGDWRDMTTGWHYPGNTEMIVNRRLEEYPVFVRAGAIIPMVGADQSEDFGTALPGTIDWWVYPGADNTFEMVEDDGDKRVISTLHVDAKTNQARLSVSGDTEIIPAQRKHRIIVIDRGVQIACTIRDGSLVDLPRTTSEAAETAMASMLDERIKRPINGYDFKNDLAGKLTTLRADALNDYLQTLKDRDLAALYYELVRVASCSDVTFSYQSQE
ncbi:glycoside hydrolase family 31 protein [Lacticaseibacillus daqingensis]|uniref:glycoside hydrolase family 31 protein n=1 Tax=Lacticaseibacillus daqingensis TaxID=2486014 RepID=UPI0013DE268E|nr:TIM-barrel domain-containing protein [Lacticaseibacillus daqingensis]